MDWDKVFWIAITFIGIGLIYLINQIFAIRRMRELEKKLNEYQALNQEAQRIRIAYIAAMENVLAVQNEIKTSRGDLLSHKARFYSDRQDLIKILTDIRALAARDHPDELDLRVLEQLKQKFGFQWKETDRLKAAYNANLGRLNELNVHFEQLCFQERECLNHWQQRKKEVLRMYDEISAVTDRVTRPNFGPE
jgi:hypothetical protein